MSDKSLTTTLIREFPPLIMLALALYYHLLIIFLLLVPTIHRPLSSSSIRTETTTLLKNDNAMSTTTTDATTTTEDTLSRLVSVIGWIAPIATVVFYLSVIVVILLIYFKQKMRRLKKFRGLEQKESDNEGEDQEIEYQTPEELRSLTRTSSEALLSQMSPTEIAKSAISDDDLDNNVTTSGTVLSALADLHTDTENNSAAPAAIKSSRRIPPTIEDESATQPILPDDELSPTQTGSEVGSSIANANKRSRQGIIGSLMNSGSGATLLKTAAISRQSQLSGASHQWVDETERIVNKCVKESTSGDGRCDWEAAVSKITGRFDVVFGPTWNAVVAREFKGIAVNSRNWKTSQYVISIPDMNLQALVYQTVTVEQPGAKLRP